MPLSDADFYRYIGPTSMAPDELGTIKPFTKWLITKEFSFCYGHRVYNQELIPEYSLDTACKCRHLHGHEGLIRVSLEAKKLDNGMVTDFKHLNWFKQWLDKELDHKFIMGLNDPLLSHEAPLAIDYLMSKQEAGHYTIKPEAYQECDIPLREKYEGMVFVNFVPTSENLSKWLFEYINDKMLKINVKTHSLQFFETPKSQSTYTIV